MTPVPVCCPPSTRTVTSQTAVECGFLRLPPKISEADWFQEHVRESMRTLVLLIKLTDLGIVILSIAFSDRALDWGVQKLTTTSKASSNTADAAGAIDIAALQHAHKPLRWSVAAVTACDLFFCSAGYLSVLLSALLLFASLLVWMTAGIPWIVYGQFNERLRKSFLTRYLNNEIEKFFIEVCGWKEAERSCGRGNICC